MIRESHRDASLVDVQSRKHIIVPRDKCLASHRSASLIQWLKFQPLYRLLGTRGEPRHPSYKSQGVVGTADRNERNPRCYCQLANGYSACARCGRRERSEALQRNRRSDFSRRAERFPKSCFLRPNLSTLGGATSRANDSYGPSHSRTPNDSSSSR